MLDIQHNLPERQLWTIDHRHEPSLPMLAAFVAAVEGVDTVKVAI